MFPERLTIMNMAAANQSSSLIKALQTSTFHLTFNEQKDMDKTDEDYQSDEDTLSGNLDQESSQTSCPPAPKRAERECHFDKSWINQFTGISTSSKGTKCILYDQTLSTHHRGVTRKNFERRQC